LHKINWRLAGPLPLIDVGCGYLESYAEALQELLAPGRAGGKDEHG
jgi:hypothetical protein